MVLCGQRRRPRLALTRGWVGAALLLAGAAFVVPAAAEPLGEYFVNLGIIERGAGKVMDDVFPVEIRPLRVNNEELLTRLRGFSFYDGATYRFLQKGADWRLFKLEPGRRPVEIRLYGMIFPPAQRGRIMMQLRRVAPMVFSEYDLENKLALMGVLGVAVSGGVLHEAFTEVWKPPPPEAGGAFPRVLLTNGETTLGRFAYDNWLDEREPVIFTADDRVAMPEDPTGKRKFLNALMLKIGPSQEMIDLGLNNEDDEIFISKADRCIPSQLKVGGVTLQLPAMKVRFVYVSQRGDTTGYGSAKAAFIPVKLGDAYLIQVYPAALTSVYCLLGALRRELYHAQWWNAVAYLDVSDVRQNRLREFLLRTDWCVYEQEIFAAVNGGKTEVVTFEADQAAFDFEARKAFLLAVARARINPESLEAASALPWTSNRALIMPCTVRKLAPDNTEFNERTREWFARHGWQLQFNRRGGAFCSLAVFEAAPTRFAPGDRVLPLARVYAGTVDPGEARNLPTAARNRFYDYLRRAVASNYTMSRQARKTGLAFALEALKEDVRRATPLKDRPALNFELLDRVHAVGFQYSDPDWLRLMVDILDRDYRSAGGDGAGYFDIRGMTDHQGDPARAANRFVPSDGDIMRCDRLDELAYSFERTAYYQPWVAIEPYLDNTSNLYKTVAAEMSPDDKFTFDNGGENLRFVKRIHDELHELYIALVGDVQVVEGKPTVRNNPWENNTRGRYRAAYVAWRRQNPMPASEPPAVLTARLAYEAAVRTFRQRLALHIQVIPQGTTRWAEAMIEVCPRGTKAGRAARRELDLFHDQALALSMGERALCVSRGVMTWRELIQDYLTTDTPPANNRARGTWLDLEAFYWRRPLDGNPLEFCDADGKVFAGDRFATVDALPEEEMQLPEETKTEESSSEDDPPPKEGLVVEVQPEKKN